MGIHYPGVHSAALQAVLHLLEAAQWGPGGGGGREEVTGRGEQRFYLPPVGAYHPAVHGTALQAALYLLEFAQWGVRNIST